MAGRGSLGTSLESGDESSASELMSPTGTNKKLASPATETKMAEDEICFNRLEAGRPLPGRLWGWEQKAAKCNCARESRRRVAGRRFVSLFMAYFGRKLRPFVLH